MAIEIQNIDNEIKEKIFETAQKIAFSEGEIKGIKADIKTLKDELKENGAELKIVNKAITIIKRDIKDENDPVFPQARQLADEMIEKTDIKDKFEDLLLGDK